MSDGTGKIGIEKPLETALDRMITLCFREFDFGKWMIWGFSAFVMLLGDGGMGGFNFNIPSGGGGSSGPTSPGGTTTPSPGFGSIWPQIQGFMNSQTFWIMLGVGAVLLGLFVALWVLFIWLQSRFEFIFLDNILQNHTKITEPWDTFSVEGQTLFKWRIIFITGYMLVLLMEFALLATVVFAMCMDSIKSGVLSSTGMAGIVIGVALLLILILPTMVLCSLVVFVIKHFIIPLMYDKAIGVGQAWRIVKPVLLGHRMDFFIYLLVRIAIAMGAGFITIMVFYGTCMLCCTSCIPFLGAYVLAVIMLPVHVFSRIMAVEFTRQFEPVGALPPEQGKKPAAIPEYDPKKL